MTSQPVFLANGTQCFRHSKWLNIFVKGHKLQHGFFTAIGGVSKGIYKSLNCGLGSKDNPDLVLQNRRLAAASLGFTDKQLFGVKQHHSSMVRVIKKKSISSSSLHFNADALVSSCSNSALTVLTADCVPVLFADLEKGVIGAAHAGWKGAVAGIIERTVEVILKNGGTPDGIEAVIGPAIQQENYQVGEDLRSQVLNTSPKADIFFKIDSKASDRLLFDLPGFVSWRLNRIGVKKVTNLAVDTYCQVNNLFSYRKATHDGLPDSGRQISIIGLVEPKLS